MNEAQARKQRSIERLIREGVPYSNYLPCVESVLESARRKTDEVALRAIALCIVALKGEGLEQPLVEEIVREYDADRAFTPKERAFIKNPDPPQGDRIQFTWRYECYWVMLWALRYVDALDRPEHICDVGRAVSILRGRGRAGFIRNALLRPQAEILDETDLIYRYDWAVVDARIKMIDDVAGLDRGVVYERHYALNWLVGYGDDWDDITTDT